MKWDTCSRTKEQGGITIKCSVSNLSGYLLILVNIYLVIFILFFELSVYLTFFNKKLARITRGKVDYMLSLLLKEQSNFENIPLKFSGGH